MTHLSFMSGVPIARLDNVIIGVEKRKKSPFLELKKFAHLDKDSKKKKIEKLFENIELVETYKEEKKIMDELPTVDYYEKVIDTHLGKDPFTPFVPLPNTASDREIVYIYAPSGCGKSVFCAEYIKEFHNKFPDKNVYLFSQLTDDPSLDALDYIMRVNLGDDAIFEASIDQYEDSLCIFDDIGGISRDKRVTRLRNHINSMKDNLLTLGRHFKIYCLITTHMAMNYQETRMVLSESQCIVVFPDGDPHFNVALLVKYGRMSKSEALDILEEPTRWIMIRKQDPKFVMTQNKLMLKEK